MLVPLHRFLIVQEELTTISRSGIVIHKMSEDQLLKAKIVSISSKIKDEFPMLEVGTLVYVRPFNFYKMKMDGVTKYIVELNDIILMEQNEDNHEE